MIIECENCGAQIDENEPKCPYCGALNEIGGERQYMEKLDDIREDMEELPQEVDSRTGKEVRGSLKIIRITVMAVLIVVALLFVIELVYKRIEKKLYDVPSRKDILLWQSENFQILDEMFEKGDFEGIVEYLDDEATDNSAAVSGMYEWKHMPLIDYYRYFNDFTVEIDEIKKNGYNREKYYWAIYSIFYILKNQYDTPIVEDMPMVEEYRAKTREMMESVLDIDEEELDELYEKCLNERGSYLDYDLTEKAVNNYLKEKYE